MHLKPNHAAVGYYKLKSDAALAYDEAVKLLKGDDCSKINFSSTQEYVNARATEVEETDSSYQTLTEIARKIQKHLSKIPCPEIDVINDAMAKKWERYLPSETGKDFLASYQKSIDEVLGFVEPEQSEVTTSTVPPTVSPTLYSNRLLMVILMTRQTSLLIKRLHTIHRNLLIAERLMPLNALPRQLLRREKLRK